jgi:hypothetical protein
MGSVVYDLRFMIDDLPHADEAGRDGALRRPRRALAAQRAA